MSLYYSLEVAADQTPEEVAQLLASDAGLKRIEGTELEGQAVSVSVGFQDEMSRQIVYEDYGFRPTLNIVFYLHPSDGFEQAKNSVARAVASVLSRVNGDAALFYNGEVLALQRTGPYVSIVKGWGDWLAPYLAEAGVSCQSDEAITPAA